MRSVEVLQLLAAVMGAVATVVTGAERKLVKRLREQDARSPETAVPLPPLNPVSRWRLARLRAAGAVRATGAGGLYLEEASYRRYRRHRVLRAVSAAVLAVAVILVFKYM